MLKKILLFFFVFFISSQLQAKIFAPITDEQLVALGLTPEDKPQAVLSLWKLSAFAAYHQDLFNVYCMRYVEKSKEVGSVDAFGLLLSPSIKEQEQEVRLIHHYGLTLTVDDIDGRMFKAITEKLIELPNWDDCSQLLPIPERAIVAIMKAQKPLCDLICEVFYLKKLAALSAQQYSLYDDLLNAVARLKLVSFMQEDEVRRNLLAQFFITQEFIRYYELICFKVKNGSLKLPLI